MNKNETFQIIHFTVLSQRDEISVNDCESSNDRRRVLLLENVDDELRLGDVAGLVRRAKAEVELLVVRLQVQRPVQEHAARVAFQSKKAAAFTQKLKSCLKYNKIEICLSTLRNITVLI